MIGGGAMGLDSMETVVVETQVDRQGVAQTLLTVIDELDIGVWKSKSWVEDHEPAYDRYHRWLERQCPVDLRDLAAAQELPPGVYPEVMF